MADSQNLTQKLREINKSLRSQISQFTAILADIRKTQRTQKVQRMRPAPPLSEYRDDTELMKAVEEANRMQKEIQELKYKLNVAPLESATKMMNEVKYLKQHLLRVKKDNKAFKRIALKQKQGVDGIQTIESASYPETLQQELSATQSKYAELKQTLEKETQASAEEHKKYLKLHHKLKVPDPEEEVKLPDSSKHTEVMEKAVRSIEKQSELELAKAQAKLKDRALQMNKNSALLEQREQEIKLRVLKIRELQSKVDALTPRYNLYLEEEAEKSGRKLSDIETSPIKTEKIPEPIEPVAQDSTAASTDTKVEGENLPTPFKEPDSNSYEILDVSFKDFHRFIKSKKDELTALGIDIKVKTYGSHNEKFTDVQAQINGLSSDNRLGLENLKKEFFDELSQISQKHEERSNAELAAHLQRKQRLVQLLQEKKLLKAQQENTDTPLDEMIDSPEKYRLIVEAYKLTGQKYTDTRFLADESSLGPVCSSRVAGWKRAGDESDLYENNATPQDVKQGALGDCYFLSAISVLGTERIEQIFIDEKPDPKCGAYCMKFMIEEEEHYVIVDTVFPVNSEGNWAFAISVTGNEIWPNVLEKAYAKIHGSYDAIAAGKVHYALADLTGGSPEEVRLDRLRNNPEPLWPKLLTFRKLNYLLGAGSPDNELGDSVVSKTGIVQGHAYAILDVVEVGDEHLINLRNPHGQHSEEWNGDWSDNSSKWTDEMKQKLNYDDADDGTFWMSFDDFVWEFKSLYICRIFPKDTWNKLETEGEWEGREAAGLPSRDNPQAVFGDNPQYLLTVSKQSTAFIELTQKNAVDMFKGKLPILAMVFKSTERIQQPNQNLIGSTGSPIDMISVSAEVILNEAGQYVILVATMVQGGTGSYILEATVDDFNSTLSKLPIN